MPRHKKSEMRADYSLTLNNLYIALYEKNNNPYTNAGAIFGLRGTLTGDNLNGLLDQNRSVEEMSKPETQPFMSNDDYLRVLNLYTKRAFTYKGSQKLFFIAHLGGWRSAMVTLSQKTDVLFNGNSRPDGGVRAEFCEDLMSWKYLVDDSGNYVFFRVVDYVGKTQLKKPESIAEHIVSCNYLLINQYCRKKDSLKKVVADFTEKMREDERKRSESKDEELVNLYDDHQEEIERLKNCLEKLILAYDNSNNTEEKEWFLARALAYLVIGAMLRETMSCELFEENFERYLPKPDMKVLGDDVTDSVEIKKPGDTLSVPEQFWQAGKTWYEEARKPGARFHSLDIVNHILPSAADKPAESEYRFPFRASDTNENTIQCSRFSELLQDKNSIYHQGHFMLIGEGGIGKTTTLMSAMQDTYEGKDTYNGESVIPLFVELSLAPDSEESHAYDGRFSSVIHRLIYAMLRQKDSKKEPSDLLRECMNDESSIAKDTIRELLTSAAEEETRYTLLIDGLNEVSPELFSENRSTSAQVRIVQEIKEIVERYPNVTVILTGRQSTFIDHPSFHSFYLRGLVWEEIEDYLQEKGKTDTEISQLRNGDKGLLEVLSIPMFLTMYVLLRDIEGITTRGELLKVFFHERFERRKNEYVIHRQGDIVRRIRLDAEQSVSGKLERGKITLSMQWMFLDILIPEIAAKMEKEHAFRISEKEVRSLLESLFKEQDSLYCGEFREYSNICFEEQLQGEDLEDVISDFTDAYKQKAARFTSAFLQYCESSIAILYKAGEKSFGFIHQHFRDYFAAVSIVNRMKIAYTAFQEGDIVSARNVMWKCDNEPLDPIMMVYVGEYLGEHHNVPGGAEDADVRLETDATEESLVERQLISNLLGIYRGMDQEKGYGVYNLVELLKRVRKNLSGTDFHNLDLRQCHFYNVPLDSKPGTIFTDASINAKNWFTEGHSDWVNSAVFSRNGNRVVTASDDGTARIWDTRTGKLLHILEGHSDQVNSAVFSVDGNWVVTSSGDGTARIWDTRTGKLLHILEGHSDQVNSAVFSVDGNWVVTSSGDGTARIWDSRTGKLLHTLEDNFGWSNWVNSAVFSEDGSRVVTSLGDGTARIWDSRTGDQLCILVDYSDWVGSAVFSEDGSRVVTVPNDRKARIWDTQTGKLLHTLEGHSDQVNSAVFSEDGSQVVTSSTDGTARIWDSRTGDVVHILEGHSDWVMSAVFSEDGSQVVTASSDGTARIWDSRTGKQLYILEGHSDCVNSAVFSEDGNQVVTASCDCSVRIWDSCTGVLLHTLKGDSGLVNSAAFSEDSKRVVTASSDGTARIWDSRTGKVIHILEGHSDWVKSAVFSKDGSQVVTASRDNTARIWDSHTGEMIHILKGHTGTVNSAVFNIDGNRVVTASSDGTARIWDSHTGEQLYTFERIFNGVESAVFSEDGKLVAIADSGRTKIWNSQTGELLQAIEGYNDTVASSIFSGDGSRLVTAFVKYYESHLALIWDCHTGKLLHTLEGYSDGVKEAVFSKDGNCLVTESEDDTIRIWDIRTGKLLHTLEGHDYTIISAVFNGDRSRVVIISGDGKARIWDSRTGKLLYTLGGYCDVVKEAIFSKDGSQIVTISQDDTARIWNSHTGEMMHDLEGHSNQVNSAVFSEDGSQVVTASSDGTARIWDSHTGEMIHILKGHTETVNSAVFNVGGNRVVTASVDGTARIWNSHTGEMIHILKGHTDIVNSAVFSEDGSRVVTASCDETARIWDSRTGELLYILEGHSDWVKSAVFSKDGSQVATVSGDNTVRIWESCTGEVMHILEVHAGIVDSAVFSGDGNQVVIESRDSYTTYGAQIWDSHSGKLFHTLEGHSDTVNSAAFNKDGSQVVTASSDGTARIWDSHTGEVMHILEGHTGTVNNAVFSGDGNQVITASEDNTVRIWDSRTGKLLHTLDLHIKGKNSAVLSGDGKRVVTVSFDHTARIWDIKKEKVIKTLYEVSGLYIRGVNFKDISPRSIVTEKQKETFRQYGALI